jgi:hypothetical protein
MPRIVPITVLTTANEQLDANEPNPPPPNTPHEVAEPFFNDDVFIPPSEPERSGSVPRPALEMAYSVDGRFVSEMTSSYQFHNWLMSQVIVWKDYLNDPTGEPGRKAEFFDNARRALGWAPMNPEQRSNALASFKAAENLLDR